MAKKIENDDAALVARTAVRVVLKVFTVVVCCCTAKHLLLSFGGVTPSALEPLRPDFFDPLRMQPGKHSNLRHPNSEVCLKSTVQSLDGLGFRGSGKLITVD